MRPIEAAINALPGCRVARNNTGALRDATGRLVVFGLGVGSADLVGIVSVLGWLTPDWPMHSVDGLMTQMMTVGRALCLEVKRPGRKLEPDHVRWAKAVRGLGGFCAVVTSVAEALACVDRCRAGLSE